MAIELKKLTKVTFDTNGDSYIDEVPHTATPKPKSKKRRRINKELLNIILIGVGFMFSMMSYSTTAMSQTVILNSIKDEHFEGTSTVGYTILCIAYYSFAISFLVAPSISALIGPKPALVLGAALLVVYVITFIRPLTITLYFGAVIQGLGQALMWTVYGHFLTENSNDKSLGRNTGIFWCLFQCSLIFGNLFYFYLMFGVDHISKETRTILFTSLIGSAVLGTVVLALIRHPWRTSHSRDDLSSGSTTASSPARLLPATPPQTPTGGYDVRDDAFASSFLVENRKLNKIDRKPTSSQSRLVGAKEALVIMLKVAISKKMLYLLPTFLYLGLELAFFINIYGTSIGYTLAFGNTRESLVGLNGVFVGVGQFAGGFVFASLGKFSSRRGRDIGVVVGFLVHITCYYLIYLSIPNVAVLYKTSDIAFLRPNAYLAMTCAVLLGFGDAAWINQIVALLGTLYPGRECLAAFAWLGFLQCFGASASFFWSTGLTLDYQLLLLVIFAVMGFAGFCILEWQTASEEAANRIEEKRPHKLLSQRRGTSAQLRRPSARNHDDENAEFE